ncbi:hypothetical protein TNCV_4527911 [Trichonephila clavipes]|nr:hypothetical protein TNCV_4527911 [Trichonephila clavipes]
MILRFQQSFPMRSKGKKQIILRTLSLETLDSSYPENEWLYVFTDGFVLTDSSNACAGVCCNLFSFYTPIGMPSTAFDADIAYMGIALSQLQIVFQR